MLKRIITDSGLPRAQIARDAGVSEASLWSWWTGARSPTSASLAKLAKGMEKRSAKLAALAEQLRTESEGGDNGEA